MRKSHKIAYAAILLALGMALPAAVHFVFPTAGKILLPMHLAPLWAGAILGSVWGAVIGFLLPPISFLLTGMPPFPIFLPMMLELPTLAFVYAISERTMRRIPVSPILRYELSLIPAIVAARVLSAAGYIIIASLGVGIKIGSGGALALIATNIVAGLPGILLQFIVVPPIGALFGKKSL